MGNSLNHKYQWRLVFCCVLTCSDLFFNIMMHCSTFSKQACNIAVVHGCLLKFGSNVNRVYNII